MGLEKPMPFMKREGGFTTPAAAVALLLVCSLLFAGVYTYRVQSRSGQIQYVADAAALAADNTVAEFVCAGQAVDAALVSLSLLGITVYAVSAVVAFIPNAQGVAAKLASAGDKILKVRDSFGRSAVKGLNAAQKALPALCAVRAAQVIEANSQASGVKYAGIALVSPTEGIEAEISVAQEARRMADGIEKAEKKIAEHSLRYEEAQKSIDREKRRAWLADCGSSGMNMRERAGHLGGLAGAQNPMYSTPDTWSFSVALARAKAYYRARYDQELGAQASGSPELVGQSVARKRFYQYALAEVSKGSVGSAGSGQELPNLVSLARNTQQIRETSLYTEAVYPVSSSGGKRVLHAYSGCPCCAAGTYDGLASVSAIDSGEVEVCEECRFSASTLGRVPAASTSIDNGFEYYYREVVEASEAYAAAVRDSKAMRGELDEDRDLVAKSIKAALKSLAGTRYNPQPPGRYGCVSIVFAPGGETDSLPFIGSSLKAQPRMAVSGATLAPDEGGDQGTVITGIAQGLVPDGAGSGVAGVAFGAWSAMLKAYVDGNDAVPDLLRKVLGALPVVGNDLSDWAVEGFEDAVKSAGLEPPDLTTYKPVLVNTSQALSRDESALSGCLAKMRQGAEMYAAVNTGDIETIISTAKACPDIEKYLSGGKLKLASLDLAELGLPAGETSIAITAPDDLAAEYEKVLAEVRNAVKGG